MGRKWQSGLICSPFPGIQTTGGALHFLVNASERRWVVKLRGRGVRPPCLKMQVGRKCSFLTNRSLDAGPGQRHLEGLFGGGWILPRGTFCLLLRSAATLLPGGVTSHPGLPRTWGIPGMPDIQFLNQDSLRQTQTRRSPYSLGTDGDQTQCWVWPCGGARRRGGKEWERKGNGHSQMARGSKCLGSRTRLHELWSIHETEWQAAAESNSRSMGHENKCKYRVTGRIKQRCRTGYGVFLLG